MPKKQALRSEETKNEILSAARTLFSTHGYHAVTMREIARKAGCSHTTIYIYFKDKEDLLQQLSLPFLNELLGQFQTIVLDASLPAKQRLKEVSRKYLYFCLENRSMYSLFFITNASRIDEQNPELKINRVRIELFQWLKKALLNCLPLDENDERLLTYSRIYFYTLHGIVSTYLETKEAIEELFKRLSPTSDEAIEILLLGLRKKINI